MIRHMFVQRFFVPLLSVVGFIAPSLLYAQDTEVPKTEATAEAEKEAPPPVVPDTSPEVPSGPVKASADAPAPPVLDAPKVTEPPKPSAPMAPAPMPPMKLPEPPKAEPPKIDLELQAATNRWVALSDAQRLDILEEWKKLPEENRIPFMIYRDEATKKVKPEAPSAPAADKVDAKPAVIINTDQPAAEPKTTPADEKPAEEKPEEKSGVGGLIDKIF